MSADSQSPSGYKLCPQCRQIYAANVELCPNDHARLIIERRILVGKYILLNRIGSATGSEVYAAEQPQLGRMVAIKLLGRDPEVERHFDSQVRSVGTVKHEHVVTLYDSGRAEDGRPYIAMEYLEGETLAERLVRSGAMPGDRALNLWRQAVSAIAAAHRRHIVHGDINPTNLFLTHRDSEEGSEEIVKVIDFHIGPRSPQTAPVDATSRNGGLVHYFAPEQLQSGHATTGSDVYSLGLVLLEMLNGRLPREGAAGGKEEISQALLLQLGQSQPAPGGSSRAPLSSELLALVGDVLRHDPARRPADAGALLQLIRRLPDVGRLPSPASSAVIRIEDPDFSASLSPPPSQSTEPDWLAGAKKAKERNSSSGVKSPAAAAPVSAAFVANDVLETPDQGHELIEDPPWLTGTVEQKIMVPSQPEVPKEDTGPTIVSKVTAEERGDPFMISETPQMGVAVLSGLLQQIQDKEKDPLRGLVAPVPVAPPAPHWSRVGLRIFLVVVVFGFLGGGLALFARFKWPLSPGSTFSPSDLGARADAAVGPAMVAVTRRVLPDLATSADPAGAAHPADLALPADAAGDKGDGEAIKIRFVYDADAVTSIECNQESLVAPNSGDKHSSGVEAILRPGGFCRASGPYGSKTYKYETVLQKRADSAGVRRLRIRLNDTSEGDAPATKKDPGKAVDAPAATPDKPVAPDKPATPDKSEKSEKPASEGSGS